MREKRRYILVRILPYGFIPDRKDLYIAVIEAATSLWGDVATGLAQPAVVFCDEGYAIVRCRRGTERISPPLTTVTAVADRRAALRTVATRGRSTR